MTRRKAVLQAVELLSGISEAEDICNVLGTIYDEAPVIRWTRDSALEAIGSFSVRYGRLPRKKDLGRGSISKPKLPSDFTMKKLFGAKYRTELERIFPGISFTTSGDPKEAICHMTRKQAMEEAFNILGEMPGTDEVCRALMEMKDDSMKKWTKDCVLEVIGEFRVRNGRLPCKEDFQYRSQRRPKLPSRKVIKEIFGTDYRQMMDEYFVEYPKVPKYAYYTKEQWLSFFREEYERLGHPTMEEYMSKRRRNTPNPKTMMKICGADTWKELLSLCGSGASPRLSVQAACMFDSDIRKKNREEILGFLENFEQ